ncbi:MAG: hypothetical protein AAF471_09180, partial [Myxococcota bacterium]
ELPDGYSDMTNCVDVSSESVVTVVEVPATATPAALLPLGTAAVVVVDVPGPPDPSDMVSESWGR